MKLYELTEQMSALKSLDDVPVEAINDTLEAIHAEFNDKAIAIRHVMTEFDMHSKAICAEIARLSEIKSDISRRKDSLENYLRDNMLASGISKIECPLFTITLRKPSKSVNVFDEAQLPDEFVTIKTTTAPDKRKIAEVLKAGDDVPGACLVDGIPALIIK